MGSRSQDFNSHGSQTKSRMGKGQNEGGFSAEQIEMYKECFKLMDVNKDGTIDKNRGHRRRSSQRHDAHHACSGGEGDSLDGAAGTDAGRENVLLVEDAALKVVGVQVGLVLGVLAISVVTAVDDGVKKISENFVGLLITGDAADGHDE